jgi:hypothetical protein
MRTRSLRLRLFLFGAAAIAGALALAGFVLATAALHGLGILGVIAARAAHLQPLARAAGLGCMVFGGVLAAQAI